MKKKKYLRAALFSIIMIVLQVGVDLMRHTEINWIEVLVGAAIVFIISIGSKSTIEVKNKGQKNKADKDASTSDNIAKNANEASNSSINKSTNGQSSEMGDLSFYSYHRVAIISLVIGVGCIVYGLMVNNFWLYLASALCFVEAIVFFILYSKKRTEFIEKTSKKRTGK